ncbi:MAG: efflux RND transporter permease subunit [Bdellovibrionota bacterium]
MINRKFESVISWLDSNPARAKKLAYLMLFGVLCMAGIGANSLRWLSTQYSMRQFMPADHPLYLSDNEIKDTFALNEEQPVLITLRLAPETTGTWLTPERIAEVLKATQKVAALENIKGVMSIATVETAVDSQKSISVGKLLDNLPPDRWAEQVKANPLLTPGLMSADQRTLALVADIGFLTTQEIDKIVRGLRTDIFGTFPWNEKVEVMVGGVVPLQADMTVLVAKELQHFLLLAFLACALTLAAYFRSISSVCICLGLVALSNIAALAWMVFIGAHFSVLSTSLPILASITALAIGSHTLLNFGNRWRVMRREQPEISRIKVIAEVYGSLFLPNFLMGLTTAIGFASLGWNKVPLVREFAWSVSGGIMISWLFISLVMPSLMYLLPVPKPRTLTSFPAKWALWVIRFRVQIFGVVAILAACVAIHGVPLNWAVRLFDDLPAGSVKSSAALVDSQLGGMIPLEVELRSDKDEEYPFHDPARIKKLQERLAHWRMEPGVGSAVSLSDFLPMGQAKDWLASRQSIAELIFLYSMSGVSPLSHFLSRNEKSVRISFRLHDIPADEMADLNQRIEQDFQSAFPDMTVKTGGMASMVHILNAELSRELIGGLWQSLMWISLLIIIIFRSLRWTIVAAIPNLLAPLALVATMSLLKTPIKPAVAIIFSIALGVAYNNTVYLLSRMKQLTVRKVNSSRDIDRAWFQEGNACLFSSLALLGGFAIFLSSYFSLNRTFGAYMLWSIAVGLFGDLVFLPAFSRILLRYLPRRLNA